MEKYENILFDLGVVLLHLEYEPALKRTLPYCDPDRVGNSALFFNLLQRDASVEQHERGEIDGPAYFERFVELTGFTESYEIFVSIWQSIFTENRPMLQFGRDLTGRYGSYLLTNTSETHVPYVFEAFPALNFIEDYAASWELGVMKPDQAFYERAMEKLKLDKNTCLFIDDRPENVEGARKFGLNSVLYTNPEETIREVRCRLGM